jgi:hypothetical protein
MKIEDNEINANRKEIKMRLMQIEEKEDQCKSKIMRKCK